MRNSTSSEPMIIDQNELEKQDCCKTIFTTLYVKLFFGFFAMISILLDLNKYFNLIKFIAKRTDWILANIPVLIFFLSCILIRAAKVDPWAVGVAQARIGSTFMKVGIRNITFNFDVKNNRKDIQKFVKELTDKSELYNYFLVSASYKDPCRVKVRTKKRKEIPQKAILTKKIDELEKFNYVPIGIGLTNEGGLGIVTWQMNNQEKVIGNDEYGVVTTLPSNSFLIAGGTGSGKSVLENNIIRHINKYHDKIMSCLVDVKKVEFGNLSNLKGVNMVATDLIEAKGALVSAQKIMMSRFKQMEAIGVNNVYNIKDFRCDYFVFNSPEKAIKVQFDEILYTKIDGEVEINTAQEIYQHIKAGKEVFIYFDGQKAPPVICNKVNKYFYLGNAVYKEDDTLTLRGGDKITAGEIMAGILQGKTYETID